MLGSERGYAFIERIEALRDVLPGRGYTNGIGMGRAPMPVYSNETNCSQLSHRRNPGRVWSRLERPVPRRAEMDGKAGASVIPRDRYGRLRLRRRHACSSKKEAPLLPKRGSIIPAASYSPTGLPLQYHRL